MKEVKLDKYGKSILSINYSSQKSTDPGDPSVRTYAKFFHYRNVVHFHGFYRKR